MFIYDYQTPLYPIREAAAAAGFELNSLRSLYQRGHFRVVGGEEAKARGLGHMLNLRDIMHVAVAKRLIDLGVHPKEAFDAALRFAHTGTGGSGWVGEPTTTPTRDPAGLYSVGFTVLIYYPETLTTKFVPMKESLDFSTLFFDSIAGKRADPVLVFLNDVERTVFTTLGVVAQRG